MVGGGDGDGGAAINAQVDPRGGEAVDAGGALPDLYFADGDYNMVRRVDGDTGIIDTIAGTGSAGYSGDGGPAVNATLRTPFDAAVDAWRRRLRRRYLQQRDPQDLERHHHHRRGHRPGGFSGDGVGHCRKV